MALPAFAGTFKVTPVGPESIKVRYLRGEPTIYSVKESGAMLVLSRGLNKDKRLVLDIVAFNSGNSPQNFGTENISLTGQNGKPITVFGFEELTRQAEKKAGWAKFWLGLAGVAGAVAASESAYSTTYGSISSRYGTSTYYAESYNPGVAAANMAVVAGATGYGFARIQGNLDNTLARLNNSILRTTTIDPGFSFGGQVITDSIKGDYPQNVALKIIWAGAEHDVEFTVTKGNQPTPPIPAAASIEATAVQMPPDSSGWTPAPESAEIYQGSDWQEYGPPPREGVRPGVVIPYTEGTE